VLKFQSTSHVLLLSTSPIFCFGVYGVFDLFSDVT